MLTSRENTKLKLQTFTKKVQLYSCYIRQIKEHNDSTPSTFNPLMPGGNKKVLAPGIKGLNSLVPGSWHKKLYLPGK